MVTVNALSLRPQGAGVSTYIRELLAQTAAVGNIPVTAWVQRDALHELPPAVRTRGFAECSGVRRGLVSLATAPPEGVFHALDVDLPQRQRGPQLATIHDLSVFDATWPVSRTRGLAERASVRRSARRADVLIADSAFTAGRIKSWLGRESEVIHLAPGSAMGIPEPHEVLDICRRYDLPATFVLATGTVEPRKDIPRLADVCAIIGVPLVLAGGDLAIAVPLGAGVRRLGFVPSADLPALYAAATAVAYASLYEGFGLPPLEAMACGAAVVCTAAADLRELCSGGAEIARVADSDDLMRALRAVIDDREYAEHLRSVAPTVAGRLSWAETARRTSAVWERLGG